MIVAIDGTTGSGKSTISKQLAQKIGFAYIRTGSFYRAIALKILREKIDYNNLNRIQDLLNNTIIKNDFIDNHVRIYLDNQDVSSEINSPDVSNFVSKVSSIHIVREYVRKLQQNSAKTCKNIVMEGRDIGSVVFPNAEVKIYIDCNIDVRAKRRVSQYKQNGINISLNDAKKAIQERDYDDMHRKESPLIKLPDAFYLDTSKYDINQCVDIIIDQIKNAK